MFRPRRTNDASRITDARTILSTPISSDQASAPPWIRRNRPHSPEEPKRLRLLRPMPRSLHNSHDSARRVGVLHSVSMPQRWDTLSRHAGGGGDDDGGGGGDDASADGAGACPVNDANSVCPRSNLAARRALPPPGKVPAPSTPSRLLAGWNTRTAARGPDGKEVWRATAPSPRPLACKTTCHSRDKAQPSPMQLAAQTLPA
jgi:hypothetical protein